MNVCMEMFLLTITGIHRSIINIVLVKPNCKAMSAINVCFNCYSTHCLKGETQGLTVQLKLNKKSQ